MGRYRNVANSIIVDDKGAVVGQGGVAVLSDARAEAICRARPMGLERLDAPPPAPVAKAPAPAPKAKPSPVEPDARALVLELPVAAQRAVGKAMKAPSIKVVKLRAFFENLPDERLDELRGAIVGLE